MTKTATPPPKPDVQDLALDQIEPHPHNVRHHLGDLTELTKSIEAQGIIEPILVLPPNLMGQHLIVAGHRRHAAALKAKPRPVSVTCVIRELTEAQVVEQMLVENMQRAEITPVEEAKAYGRLIDLDSTVASIARKVGRTQKHVKGRLALLRLPDPVLELLDEGSLNLGQAESLLEPDDLDEVTDDDWAWFAGVARDPESRFHRFGNDPVDVVSKRVAERQRDEKVAAEVAKLEKAGLRRYEPKPDQWGNWSPPWELTLSRPCPLSLLKLSRSDARKHRNETCHAVLVRPERYGYKVDVVTYCTDPKRHTTKAKDAPRSTIQIDPDLYTTTRGKKTEKDPLDKERTDAPRRQWESAATALRAVKRLDDDLLALLLLAVDDEFYAPTWEKVCDLLGLDVERNQFDNPDPKATIRTHIATPANRAQVLAALAYALCHAQTAHAWTGRHLVAVDWVLAHGHEPTELEGQLIDAAHRAATEDSECATEDVDDVDEDLARDAELEAALEAAADAAG